MITKENLSRGEGELVEGDTDIGSRKRKSQSDNIASIEGLSQNEKDFQKKNIFHVEDGRSVV
jgi:hypothetical protein